MAAVGASLQYALAAIAAAMSDFPPQGHGTTSSGSDPFPSVNSPSSGFHPDHPPAFDLSDYLLDVGSAPASFGPPETAIEPMPDALQIGQSAATNLASSSSTTRTERIAFRMKSEVEILDDGFKWRKYGKKSVKNSPNPRNYYRCSTEGCSVKKRVERDKDDPSYVITTYEGVHNHTSPGVVYYAGQDAASGRYYVAGMQMPPGSSS